jgi:hypothetical protein
MWSYDPDNLDTSTPQGRLNVVRLLIGDTIEDDPLVRDEEVVFALSQSINPYTAASWCCGVIAAKFAREVTTTISGTLREQLSDKINHYSQLQRDLERSAKRFGNTLGVWVGGVNSFDMGNVESDPTRVQPRFKMGQFDNPPTSYAPGRSAFRPRVFKDGVFE